MMDKNVIVYTTTDCVECSLVKQMLTQVGIDYELRDVSENDKYQEEIEALGFPGVPVTVVNGRAIKGYRPEEILEQINRR